MSISFNVVSPEFRSAFPRAKSMNLMNHAALKFGSTPSLVPADSDLLSTERIMNQMNPVPFQNGFNFAMRQAAQDNSYSARADYFVLGSLLPLMSLLNSLPMLPSTPEQVPPQWGPEVKEEIKALFHLLPPEARGRNLNKDALYRIIFSHMQDDWYQKLLDENSQAKGTGDAPAVEPEPEFSLEFTDETGSPLDHDQLAQLGNLGPLAGLLGLNGAPRNPREMTLSKPLQQLLTGFIKRHNTQLDRTLGAFIGYLEELTLNPTGVDPAVLDTAQRVLTLRADLKEAILSGEAAEPVDKNSIDGLKTRYEEISPLVKNPEQRSTIDQLLKSLENTSPSSPDYSTKMGQAQTILFNIPWTETPTPAFSKDSVRAVLDADHYGLDEIKDRIVRSTAQQRYVERLVAAGKPVPQKNKPLILLFVGPPGVGKTSLGQSIAKATGREFIRMSLGGVSDEAEIRGHRSTYIGAKSGRVADALVKVKTLNPLIMLDEIDKLGRDWKGDPSSALLEVLDPSQNHAFYDNYLGMPIDLSKAMFIATANSLETIPGPLLDRMDVIELRGYTPKEKAEIVKRHFLDRASAAKAIDAETLGHDHNGFVLSDEVIQALVKRSRQPGVRYLEKAVHQIAAAEAERFADLPDEQFPPRLETFTRWTVESVADLLGPNKSEEPVFPRTDDVGFVKGLYYLTTGIGGVLPVMTDVEVKDVKKPEQGGLVLKGVTGNMKEVMKESAQVAFNYVTLHAKELGIPDLDKKRFEVYISANDLTPKDGPSAGAALTLSLISALTGRKVRGNLAMTGAMNQRGAVTPIGAGSLKKSWGPLSKLNPDNREINCSSCCPGKTMTTSKIFPPNI